GGDLVAVSVHQVAAAAGDGAEGHIVQGALGILVLPEVLEVVDVELHILAGLGGVDDVAGGGGAFLDLEGDGAGVVVLALFIHIGSESKRNIALVILVGGEGHIFQIVIIVILILGRSIQLAALGRDAVKLYIYKFIMAAEFFNGVINLIHHGIAALHVLVAKSIAAGIVDSNSHRNIGGNLNGDCINALIVNS